MMMCARRSGRSMAFAMAASPLALVLAIATASSAAEKMECRGFCWVSGPAPEVSRLAAKQWTGRGRGKIERCTAAPTLEMGGQTGLGGLAGSLAMLSGGSSTLSKSRLRRKGLVIYSTGRQGDGAPDQDLVDQFRDAAGGSVASGRDLRVAEVLDAAP